LAIDGQGLAAPLSRGPTIGIRLIEDLMNHTAFPTLFTSKDERLTFIFKELLVFEWLSDPSYYKVRL
jgi:hypothetical protein